MSLCCPLPCALGHLARQRGTSFPSSSFLLPAGSEQATKKSFSTVFTNVATQMFCWPQRSSGSLSCAQFSPLPAHQVCGSGQSPRLRSAAGRAVSKPGKRFPLGAGPACSPTLGRGVIGAPSRANRASPPPYEART